MLAGQAAAVALTQKVACAHLLRAYPLLAYFFSRLVDVWGAVGRVSLLAILGGWNGGDDHELRLALPPPPDTHAGGNGAAALLPPTVQTECATHACRFVLTLLYTGVGGLTWVLAPQPGWRARRVAANARRSADALDAALAGGLVAGAAALATWVGLAVLLPRPPCCGGGAAASTAWEAIQRGA